VLVIALRRMLNADIILACCHTLYTEMNSNRSYIFCKRSFVMNKVMKFPFAILTCLGGRKLEVVKENYVPMA